MTFKVLLDPRAAKALKKLNEKTKERVKKALGELAVNPYEAGQKIHPSQFWKIEARDYRAIYEINSESKEVVILFVGHRRNVYDDFRSLLY